VGRRLDSIVGLIMAAVVLAYVADLWSDGAVSRIVRGVLAAPVDVPTGRDVSEPAIAGVMDAARRITGEGGAT
jgi:hypothetical protein